MPPRETRALLEDALMQVDDLLDKASGASLQSFLANRDLQAIVERRFEVLGEALRRLERIDRPAFEKVPGARQAIGLRNIISHGYDGIDHRLLWDTMGADIPPMRAAIALALS